MKKIDIAKDKRSELNDSVDDVHQTNNSHDLIINKTSKNANSILPINDEHVPSIDGSVL